MSSTGKAVPVALVEVKDMVFSVAIIGEGHMMRCTMDRNTPPDLVNRNARFDRNDADAPRTEENA
jgi:phosphotransferase system IIA component